MKQLKAYVIEDFADLLEVKIMKRYSTADKTADYAIRDFFLYAYYAYTVDAGNYQYYMDNDVGNRLSGGDKRSFKTSNALLKSKRLDFLDNSEFYCEFFKGHICPFPQREFQEKQTLEKLKKYFSDDTLK
ncbi:unnamed protein product [Didymodactylos carnosus]|uniref:Uncharacterized protein n=1 Tax=Didymodactylos carnosus TaxID=1234261 RepID=A0A815J820_9BILA|nr:unnamed protein product [Didymodactylos carnosus]CAF4271766.1 unnamed protein product [Didymodactylos carnosus]